ncbi:MAG: tyrosine--tRNA ligase [Candidatus Aenigmarchaeota archaeon]|nr:tyrosine--tRNA ligase [Candidatus Aenigmarchaeota archaeon]
METEEKVALIKSFAEEILTEEELVKLFETKTHPVAYDGFEPSGKMHIAQGLMRAINVNKFLQTGCHFKMLIADWHAWANNKMGGDLEKIQTVGKYFIEIWRAAGMDVHKVEFVWVDHLASDKSYWKDVMTIARTNTLKRVLRCSQIMGRSESDSLSAAQILYPCMQAADIFKLGADITNLGMDQRKVNVLAREVGETLGFWKPVVVSNHMLLGLQRIEASGDAVERAIEMKMSKSKPDTAIFMTDPTEEIARKIGKAYCPEKQLTENPIMEYFKYIFFELNKSVMIERAKKFGGDLELASYDELAALYAQGGIHPQDLKTAAVRYIDQALQPVRTHFEQNEKARELLAFVNEQQVTR